MFLLKLKYPYIQKTGMSIACQKSGIISKINIKATAMQDILSFVQTASTLPVASVSTEAIKSDSSDGSFSESFFSMILSQFKEEEQAPLTDDAVSTVTLESSAIELTTDQEAKSIDEHLLEDLLSVVNALQQDSQTTTFPTLNASPTLEKLLASEATRQEFASVSSVSDLMSLSEKYNLGLEKLSISTETLESLQTKFPTLAQNNFFDDLETALSNTQTTLESDLSLPTTTSNIMSILDKQTPQTSSTSTATSILGELISKELKTDSTTTNVESEIDITSGTTADELSLKVNEKQQSTLAQILQTPEEEIKQVTTPLETTVQKTANANETKKAEIASTEVSVDEESIQVSTTRVNKTAIEEDTSKKDDSLDTIVETVKTEKTTDEVVEEEMMQIQKVVNTEDSETTTVSSDESQTTIDTKHDLKTTLKHDIPSKTSNAKESLSQFASDLKEKIEAYKPPIMKVELSLSPKNLGDVDVTLLTRGNNLHVNISSNTTTMSLFTQNQSEVKNALVSMGFTNLEMNFSDQQNKEQAQQNSQKNSSGSFEELTTEQLEEETASLEIVIPQYV